MKNQPMDTENGYIGVAKVMEITGAGRASAYATIRVLNAELQEKGYLTFAGRVPKKYFLKRCGLDH